ncbi:extracellular solute-binding protein [Siccirubricoccus sp. KC 17139]|uniref:Extracellular solute-binding protein n=1 Tax=Siccirubricoccus soli TaxID=2899147 RepID=A0ABT1D560_9PROT|nr:extracellular solute-binding protein [Siccirubricoccus soli]MCO6417066.1 extracellular solute-binding protein [Siccirubricoccus soli]MCP2683201.1 extracellular solute-binding protein [Siccirubricoccus soli]
MQTFQQDCVELALRRFRRGEVSRRELLAGLVALGAVAPGAGALAQAERQIVMVNWGGLANQGFGDFYGKPFMAENPGTRVVQDSTGPATGRIRSMVESGRVTWDVCDSSATGANLLGKLGLAAKMDYSIINREDVIGPGFALEYGVAPYSFSSVLVYDSAKFPNGGPTNWADFWDLRKFPGTRLLRRDASCVLEAALMSMGRAPYPVDIRTGIRRVMELRRNLVFWTNGSESEQLMRTGEAEMGQIWHTRASVLHKESNGRFKFLWNQAVLQPGIQVVPKGNPAGELAQKLLASMLAKPEPQVGLLGLLGNGPTNPKAAAMVPAELRQYNPTDPANEKQQVVLDGSFWGENYQQANQDFLDAVTG